MSIFRTTIDSPRSRAVLLTACMAALGLGCAPTDDDATETSSESAASPSAAAPGSVSADEGASEPGQSIDKALRKDYCCAGKKGDRVKWCADMHLTKASAGLSCEATLTDNIVRDGKCSKYKSCEGKMRESPPGWGISIAIGDKGPPDPFPPIPD